MSLSQDMKKFLHSHSRLDYAYRFFKHFNNKVFFENATLLNRVGDGTSTNKNFIFQSFGEMNPRKPLYYIRISQHQMGLLSFFTAMSHMLAVADLFGFTPVIEWNSRMYMRDNDSLQSNIFEYYFDQPADISVADAMKSKYVAMAGLSQKILPSIDPNGFILNDNIISITSPSVAKFVRLNSNTAAHITSHINSVLEGKKTLAIHVRGGGFRDERCIYHPVAIPPSQHIAAAKEAVAQYGFERIFLATDEEDTVDLFKQEFGSLVITHNDATRTGHGEGIDLAVLTLAKADSRPEHKYLMGLEVLTDVYTMAACQGLIAGRSNVSNAALIINGNRYEHKSILYDGIYGFDVPNNNNRNSINQKTIKRK